MPRPEKVQAVEEIRDRFNEASASFVTEYRGLTVGQQQRLRNALREAGASYKVLKMTLTRRALDEIGNTELSEFLFGPTAIAFAGGDPAPVAKALHDFSTEHEALVIKAGWYNGEILTPETVAKLAKLESRDVLLAKIAGAAKAPMSKLAGMLGSMTRDAASVFSQLLERKEADAPAAETPAEDVPPEEAPAEESTAEQSTAEPDAEESTAEQSTAEQSTAEPDAEESTAEPDAEESTAEPDAEESTAESAGEAEEVPTEDGPTESEETPAEQTAAEAETEEPASEVTPENSDAAGDEATEGNDAEDREETTDDEASSEEASADEDTEEEA